MDTNKEINNGEINNGAQANDEVNPFQRSSKVVTSPQGATNKENESEQVQANAEDVMGAVGDDRQSDLELLGVQIGVIVKMVADKQKRHITQAHRDEIERAQVLYTKVATEMGDRRAAEMFKENSTQTSPWLKNLLNKRKPANDVETPTSKRVKNRAQKKDSTKSDQRSGQKLAAATSSANDNTNKERPQDYEWRQVERKKPARKPKPLRKPRPDAIVIGAKDGQSYADILRKVKADPNLTKLGEAVTRIRRTQKGELLLQFKDSGDNTATFQSTILEKIGELAEVRTLTHRTMVEIRDVDEITSERDVSEALKAQLAITIPDDAIRLRKAYGGTQIATIKLPGEEASKMIKAGKIRIGWTICRIRERTELKKCFKCLEFGHIATQCRNQDRSKLCRKCGKDGHIAKDCTADPMCMFCSKDKAIDAKHVAGSSRCPVFRRAMKNKG